MLLDNHLTLRKGQPWRSRSQTCMQCKILVIEHLCISVNEIWQLIRLVITNINFTPWSATTTTKTTTVLRLSWYTKTKSWNDTEPADYMTSSLDYKKEIQVNKRSVQYTIKETHFFFLNCNKNFIFQTKNVHVHHLMNNLAVGSVNV